MLDLIWFAKFKDGKVIKQFDDSEYQNGEHSFKEVLDRQDDLVQFALLNIHTKVLYILNLYNGTINITLDSFTELEADEDMLRDNLYKYRLIYFRRVSRHFTANLIEVGNADIVSFLGFQFTDKNGNNQKRLMKINKDGRIIVN